MPFGSITLKPGVFTEQTPSVNEAGVSQSQLIRYKEGLVQSYGGWATLFSGTIGSTIRDLHPWQGIGVSHPHLGIGATASLSVYHSDTGTVQDITPQTTTTNPTPNFSISSGSQVVTVGDVGSSATIFNTVYFNTPIAIGKYLLNGPYPINSVIASSVYTILLPSVSTTDVVS